MTDIPNVTPEQEEAKLYTQRELFQLFQQWQKDSKNEQQRVYEETELPNDIREILEESPLHQLKENLKRYKKHVHKYYHEEWATGESINKSFIQKYKRHNVDTYQVLNTIYRIADNTRIAARATTEIYEKQLYLHTYQATMAPQEAIQLLDEIIEDTKRLAVFNWVSTKQQDTGIPRISIQLQGNEDHSTRPEDEQITQENTASTTTNSQNMPVDGKFIGKGDGNDPGNRGGTTSYTISTTGFVKDITNQQARLRNSIPDVNTQQERITMV